jgi:hypothetical protein
MAEEEPAKEMLSRLESLGPDDPGFLPLLEQLRLAVLAHARAEERYEFIKLREVMDPATLAQLARAEPPDHLPAGPHTGRRFRALAVGNPGRV